ncbi:MAG: hypothetical protein COA52_15920 [Hyphomicrobiales bacterium]|nr:MAG: hypothetical protein COA52_15920 [Hyphomicrobiales bacterium]
MFHDVHMSTGQYMHTVGHHLQVTAVAATANEKDAYARSAYNRYYYGAFLNARDMLSSLDPAWSSLAHASYPRLLKGQIRKEISRKKNIARRNGDIELVGRTEKATRAVDELAKILNTAYSIRVVADYEPNEAVTFGPDLRFALRSVDISEAHEWESQTRILCNNVKAVWDEIHG